MDQQEAAANDRVENEHDSSFSDNSFSSDDEFKRDGHYRPLYRQDSEENSTFDEESSDDDENDIAARVNENGLYNHNVIVEWISTNEPLFDRPEYEARLRRIIDEPANMDDSDSDYDVPKENQQNKATNSSSTTVPAQSNVRNNSSNDTANTASTSKKDIQIGEDKSKTIMNIMSSFTLPTDNRPDWAKNISEQEWKQHLDSKLSPTDNTKQS